MNFGKYLYDQLPSHYRYRDIETEYTLERYLQCVGEFLNLVFQETGEIKDLLNVSTMPSKFLPYYAKTFGITLYDDMTEDFQRRLLSNIIPILKRKGTRDVIEFVVREITGYDVDITEGSEYAFRTWVDELYLPLGVKQGLTYSSIQAVPYRYGGTDATSRFIIFVEIHTDEIEAQINEEVIRKYLLDLVPSYIKLVFVLNKHLIDVEDYSDIITLNITEDDFSDIEVVSDRTYGSVTYSLLDTLKFITEVVTVNNNIMYSVMDKISILEKYVLNAVIREGDITDIVTPVNGQSSVAPTPIPDDSDVIEPPSSGEIDVTLPSQDKTDPLYFPTNYKETNITNNYQLVARAYDVLNNYNTVYLYGGVGQVLTQSVLNAKASQYPSFYTSSRKAKYNDYLNSGKTYWGFDCVNLYKALLWGWCGDTSKSYGGATYVSNGVPDASANGLFSYCTNTSSTNWDKMPVGEVLWLDGHFGIYVGGGKAIECTPKWTKIGTGTEWNGVQLTAVLNCTDYPTNINGRTWTKHGKLPYVDYLSSNPFVDNTEDIANTTGKFVAQTYLANVTSYYPDESTGGYQDSMGNTLVGYPTQLTCEVPSSVSLGSKVMITGTNTEYDGKIFTATETRSTLTVNNGTFDINLCLQTKEACDSLGTHKGNNVKVSIGDVVTSSRKVAITKQNCNVRSGKGTNYSIVGVACSNYRFTVLDDSDEWIAVEYHGDVAYVKGTLLTIVTI